MQWIQTIIFLLAANGLLTLFGVRFNDFLHMLARTRKSWKSNSSLRLREGKGGSLSSNGSPSLCSHWGPWQRCS